MRQVPKKRKAFTSLFFITFFDHVSLTIGFPVLTFICFDVHSRLFSPATSHVVRSFWYGTLSATPHLIAILAAPVLGYLSDHFGRKKLLLISALGALFLCFFSGLGIYFGSLSLVVLACMVGGLYTRTEPIALAVVADLSSEKEKIKYMGFLQLFISMGALVGPLLGGYFAQRLFFHELNFSLPAWIGVGFSLLTLLLTICLFKESYIKGSIETFPILHQLRRLLTPNLLKLFTILLLTQFSWRIYYQFIPPVLKVHFHYSTTFIGLFIAGIALWLAIASSLGIMLLSRFFETKKILRYSCYVLFMGNLLAIVGTLLPVNGWSQSLTWFAAIPVAMSDVIAYSAIVTLLSNTVSKSQQGQVMGLMFVMVAIIWSITGFLGGSLAAISITLPIIIAPVSLILLFLWFIIS